MLLEGAGSARILLAAAAGVRDQNRFVGRKLPSRAAGSTLLLKGLESDHALILNADRMTAPNLYVALSRGSRFVTIFSTTPVLPLR
jgi:DNA helicase-2/ATP-dependent DNA helicase PcrA